MTRPEHWRRRKYRVLGSRGSINSEAAKVWPRVLLIPLQEQSGIMGACLLETARKEVADPGR